MEGVEELNKGVAASPVMRDLAALAVEQNGGAPIVAKPEDIAALEAAQRRLRQAGLPISGVVELSS